MPSTIPDYHNIVQNAPTSKFGGGAKWGRGVIYFSRGGGKILKKSSVLTTLNKKMSFFLGFKFEGKTRRTKNFRGKFHMPPPPLSALVLSNYKGNHFNHDEDHAAPHFI